MRVGKISIKTDQQPDGIEVEIIIPEPGLEEQTLGFLMVSFLRELKQLNGIPYHLPDRFVVEHKGNGALVAFSLEGGGPGKPIAMFGLRPAGNSRFDLVHAPIPQ